jgi:type 1 glutamine amidotransferase
MRLNLHITFAALFGLLWATIAAAANLPTIVLVSGEDEYHSAETLPVFARFLQTEYAFKTVYLERKKPDSIDGLDALDRADLLVVFARRITLPEEQLKRFQKYFEAGKPVIGIRTASHAFQNWLVFDKQVLGGNYQNHYGKDSAPKVQVNPLAKGHPILRGVPETFASAGSLYRNTPLQTNTTLLLTGTIPDHSEPVAWTHNYKGARVFYTSLGHPDDFKDAAFRTLLVNAVHWALNKPVPASGK